MHDHTHRKHYALYVCEGGCGAQLTPQDFEAHETKVCGTEGCSGKGHAFVRKQWCEDCKEVCDGCESCEV